jgi:phage baseplate assembly protein W
MAPQPKPIKPRYIDVSLAFRANPVTGDVTTLIDAASIQVSVVNLVMTRNFEIPFHPEQGCAVMNSLFENITPMTCITIRRSILDVLQNYEPRVMVIGVNVSADPDHNGYNASITYQIVGQTAPVTVNLFLEKLR